MHMTSSIHIRGLNKQYPNGTQALKNIDLDIQEGRFFTLLGPNGAGKSTLINILTTLIKSDAGSFHIDGIDPAKNPAQIQKRIGVASQENELDPYETPENLLKFQGRLFGLSKHKAGQRAGQLLEQFQLEAHQHKKTEALSGGNKRRLHCALALVHRPHILFLDEPTVGMDPLARDNFWNTITSLNREEGITLFLTTQYLEEADKHATDMALIVDGSIHYNGSIVGFKHTVNPHEALTLDESYLYYIRSLQHETNTIIQ